MSKGSPKLDVRAPADQQAAWKEAAKAAGMDWSAWVRWALETAAKVQDTPTLKRV